MPWAPRAWPRPGRPLRRPAASILGIACLVLSLLLADCRRQEGPVQALPAVQAQDQASALPGPEGKEASASPARLLRGPEAVHGLPFFGPNALPALRGEYGLGRTVLKVWSCRERLVFGSSWKPVEADSRPGLRAWRQDGERGPVLALVSAGYALFFELPEEGQAFHRFALAMESRFQVFFENAGSDAELSFPAFVVFQP
jgi:hypothetical protein